MPVADYRPSLVSEIPTIKSHVPPARSWMFSAADCSAGLTLHEKARWSDILQMADYFLCHRSLLVDQILLTEYFKSKDSSFPGLTPDDQWCNDTIRAQMYTVGEHLVANLDLTNLNTLVGIREFIKNYHQSREDGLLKSLSITNQDVFMMLVRAVCYASDPRESEFDQTDLDASLDPSIVALRQLTEAISTNEAYRVLDRNPAFLISALEAIAHWRHGSAFLLEGNSQVPSVEEVILIESFRDNLDQTDPLAHIGGGTAILKAFLVFQPHLQDTLNFSSDLVKGILSVSSTG